MRKESCVLKARAASLKALLTTIQDAEACKPGEIYAEGTRVGFCWGSNGNGCAKCIKV